MHSERAVDAEDQLGEARCIERLHSNYGGHVWLSRWMTPRGQIDVYGAPNQSTLVLSADDYSGDGGAFAEDADALCRDRVEWMRPPVETKPGYYAAQARWRSE